MIRRLLVSRRILPTSCVEDAVSKALGGALSSSSSSLSGWMSTTTVHDGFLNTSTPRQSHSSDNTSNASHTSRRGYSSKVPEFWGKESPYHPGTEFLGTPQNHLELVQKRPLSPHVFDDVGTGSMPPKFHYKMPLGAVSSVTNRATGVMLSCGAGAAGWVALVSGDLGAAIASFKSAYPLLVFPAKFAVAFPLLYHYLGGLRHLYWDHYSFGNQSERNSPLEYGNMEQSSKALLLTGTLGAAALALYTV